MQNVLFIIGNGFDLSLGLKSKYSDFYDYLQNEHSNLRGKDKYGYNIRVSDYKDTLNKISIWPVIISHPYEKWIDIEFAIKEFLLGKNSSKFITLDKLLNHERNLVSREDSHTRLNALYDILKISDAKKIEYENDRFRFIYNNIEKEVFKLEETFKDYLIKISKQIDYNKIAQERFLNLLTLNNSFSLTSFKNISILNFNYTSILKDASHINYSVILSERNIHGNFIGKIIFGIDSNNIKAEEEHIYRFTKTFKVINNGYSYFNSNTFKINTNVDCIYFYGHSLGEQDYSYFQSIFDSVNLYNGKTKLIFIYSDDFLNDDEKEKHRFKTNLDIAKLIEKYGESFETEKIKGKNLFHKLIVENRIQIILLNPEDN